MTAQPLVGHLALRNYVESDQAVKQVSNRDRALFSVQDIVNCREKPRHLRSATALCWTSLITPSPHPFRRSNARPQDLRSTAAARSAQIAAASVQPQPSTRIEHKGCAGRAAPSAEESQCRRTS